MLSHEHTKRAAYLMPISAGPGVTQVEAFKEIKDRVSSAAPHGAAGLTGSGKNGAPMSNKVKGKEKRRRDRCTSIAHKVFHRVRNAHARAGRVAERFKMSKPTRKIQPSAGLTVHVLEDVENGEDLPVVGHQRLPHHVGRRHQVLQDLQGGADHLTVSGVQGVWKVKVREGH